MAVKWQVKFRSQRADTLYTVSIYQDYYTGDPIELIGAANPFETQEDDSEDVFKPIRTQSGYLRIVDNGYAADGQTPFNWRDFIPTTDIDRPVVLTHEDENRDTVIDWMGTLQAQNFGARIYEDVIEREFPVQCPLTVMSHSDVTTDNKRIRNFAEMLLIVMNSIPFVSRPDRFVFQGGNDAKDWLLKKVDWSNFIDQNRDFTAKGKYDNGTILEHMCKYWGWTARVDGDTLYMMCPDDTGETKSLVFTSSTQLGDFADGQNVGQVGDMFPLTNTIGNIYSTVENMDYQDRGPNKVTVKVDPNDHDDYIIDPFDAELVKQMNGAGTWNEGTTEDNGTDYWHYTKGVFSLTRLDLTGTAPSYGDHIPWRGASFNILSKMNPAPTYGYSEVGNVIRIIRTYNGYAFMKFETVYEHCFSDGFFRILADTYREGSKYENGNYFAGNPTMKMKLGVGWTRETAKWWDGRAWQNSECEFLATLGNKKPELFTRYQISSTSSEQTSIIATGTLYGCLFVDLLGSDDSRVTDINGQKSFDLLNFRIEFQKNDNVTKQQYPNSDWWDIKENLSVPDLEYEASNYNMVRDDYNVDCIFGSNDGIPPGKGILMNADGSYMSTVQYGNDASNQERPEQHLADRISDYWAASKRRITCGLLTHDGTDRTIAAELSPRKKIIIDGTTLYPYAISHRWWDDEVDVMAMEVPVVVTYTVSGIVTDGTNALSGVTVTIGELTATTDLNGAYSISDVIVGSYTIIAVKELYLDYSNQVDVSGDTTVNVVMIETPIKMAEQYFTARKGITYTSNGSVVSVGGASGKRCYLFAMPFSSYANAGYSNIKVKFATGIQYVMGVGTKTSDISVGGCVFYDSSGNQATWSWQSSGVGQGAFTSTQVLVIHFKKSNDGEFASGTTIYDVVESIELLN